jgi:hypothetical protein
VLSPAAVRADIAQVAASVVELYGPPERPQ